MESLDREPADANDDGLDSPLQATVTAAELRMEQLGDAVFAFLDRKSSGFTQASGEFLSEHEPLSELLNPLVQSERPPEIPDYEAVRVLGRGAFGAVWMARSRTGVYRAVKVIAKEALASVEFEGVHTLENLSTGHPNLIEIKHVGEIDEGFYYVMPLADGYSTSPNFDPSTYVPRSLQSDLDRRSRLPLAEAAEIVRQVLAGVKHLHLRGLLHRDIKPGNIVFLEGVAKIADLGLVSRASRQKFQGHTPNYAPPEGVVDRSGDLFCVARMLYEMVSGLSPRAFPVVPDGSMPEARDQITKLLPILERACAKLPAERFQNADEFLAALDRVVEPVHTASSPKWGWGAIALAAATLFAIVLAFQFGPKGDPSGSVGDDDPQRPVVEAPRFRVAVSHRGSRLPIETRLPLAGDSAYGLSVELPMPRRLLVFYLSDQSVPQLVTDTAEPVAEFRFPRAADEVLPLPGGRTHCFVLLVVSGDAAPGEPNGSIATDEIAARLEALGPPPSVPPDSILSLAAGEVTVLPSGQVTRAVDFSRARRDDLNILYRLDDALGDHFESIHAVAFYQEAE